MGDLNNEQAAINDNFNTQNQVVSFENRCLIYFKYIESYDILEIYLKINWPYLIGLVQGQSVVLIDFLVIY